MSTWRNKRQYVWIGLFVLVAYVIYFLDGHTLSGDVHEKPIRDVQDE